MARRHALWSGVRELGALQLLLVVIALGACGGDGAEVATSPAGGSAPAVEVEGDRSTTSSTFDANQSTPGGDWPAAIPADIPALRNGISDVLGGADVVRIFYSGVAEHEFLAYIQALDDAGFGLEYLVYASDVDPERAEEKAAAGEWDAVRATRGAYTVGVEFGSDQGTLSISGPMETLGPDTSWPSEWAGIPAPSGLTITNVRRFGSDPIVTLEYDNDADIEGYVDELADAGFAVTNRSFNQDDRIMSVTASDGVNEVQVRSYGLGDLEISVAVAGDPPTTPVETRQFPEYLPEVPGGTIAFATVDPQGGFSAVVTIEEGHTVAEYLEVLGASGWEETDEATFGRFILTDGTHHLTIFDSPSGFVPIQISLEVSIIDP